MCMYVQVHTCIHPCHVHGNACMNMCGNVLPCLTAWECGMGGGHINSHFSFGLLVLLKFAFVLLFCPSAPKVVKKGDFASWTDIGDIFRSQLSQM